MYNRDKSYKENVADAIEMYQVLQDEDSAWRSANRWMKNRDYAISVAELNKMGEKADDSKKADLFRQCAYNVQLLHEDYKSLLTDHQKNQGQAEYWKIMYEKLKSVVDTDYIATLERINADLIKKNEEV